jgi:hypothetical protein
MYCQGQFSYEDMYSDTCCGKCSIAGNDVFSYDIKALIIFFHQDKRCYDCGKLTGSFKLDKFGRAVCAPDCLTSKPFILRDLPRPGFDNR